MADITNLDDWRPHKSGPARCLGCKHEWTAVMPASNVVTFECPSCGCSKGVWQGICLPPEGEAIWVCGCGNDLFFKQENGCFCPICGSSIPL